MKYIVQAVAGALIVVLAMFAVADAYRSGVSYATAVLAITAAILAMITLFTAPDAARLHRQLDELRQEVREIRLECRPAGNAAPPAARRPAVPACLVLGAALLAAAALWRRRKGDHG